MRSLLRFIQRAYRNRSVIRALAWREIQVRYVGTFAGLVWSVAHPLIMVLIYWFVFSMGFKVQPSGNVPFIVAFLCGLIPWTTMAETLTASTTAVTGNPHLVKKTVFPTELLPFVHLSASMVSHLIMLAILLVVMAFYGMPFSFYNFQFLYFLAGLSVFCAGLGWIVSALNVFYRDVGQILAVVLNMWFWLTPVVYPEEMFQRLPQYLQFLPMINPMYYIVHGYRMSFYLHTGFWENWGLGIYFWTVSLGLFTLGGWLFRRLKPDFPEVL